MYDNQIEPLTDKEKRIFLAAMGREKIVCKEVDNQYVHEAYEDTLTQVCNEIIRKVKSALWKPIRDMPAVDVTQVVRCKDCVHNELSPNAEKARCFIFYNMTDVNGFCHFGERRKNC